MKVLILSIFLACASAQYYPGFYGYPATSQFHAQDVLGQASYGYAYPGQAASNYRDIFGNQVGSYAYMGPKGEVRVNYVADAVNGFRVVSNNLPVAPEDTPEVAAAKIEHAKLVKEAATKKAAEPAASRTKRQVPFYPSALPYALPYTAPYYNYVAPAPLVAKTTLKTVTAEADPSAKTPADTTKFDLKEKSFDVVTPVAYPYAPYGYTYPFAAPTAVESSRKKRQIIIIQKGKDQAPEQHID
ncbi:cuticle protein 18.6-like [Daphnia pulicaria]|uniref:cuticle protein 18.6-like n=1 Tax=Daphnia pulicaria TaxID=35523 RepID=UPI001EECBE81|nr:cuticle protein 18.6-like [Daphnia pulicaria]